MNIKQFRYDSDNLAYMVYDHENAVAIDPGAVEPMIAFAEKMGLRIRWVTNTHDHFDHIQGNDAMLQKTGADFIDNRSLSPTSLIPVGRESLKVYLTPGHMKDCVTFGFGQTLITGDTLFNGTVGTCFSGDMSAFLESILFLMSFPLDTRIYAGHDYVRESMAFARTIDRDNPQIDAYLARYNPAHVVSTLADELTVNPFLRFDDPAMITIMEKRGLPVQTRLERWHSLLELY